MDVAITFILIFIVASGCDPIDDRLVIANRSDSSEYYLITEYESLKSMYDQKLVDDGVTVTFKNYVFELGGGGERRHIKTGSATAWEDYIEKVCENRRLHIYTFDIGKLQQYSWKDVVENGFFRARVSYSLDEIRDREWMIVLP